jgi:methylated-DNA-protein-cysteine methyltransferase-like protein
MRYIIYNMQPSFSQRVYDLALTIPPGFVTTYGGLAKAAGGGAMASRSITSILGKAPNQSSIPYHRIVYAGGKVWLPKRQEEERREMYAVEDITVNEKGQIKDFEEIVWEFS